MSRSVISVVKIRKSIKHIRGIPVHDRTRSSDITNVRDDTNLGTYVPIFTVDSLISYFPVSALNRNGLFKSSSFLTSLGNYKEWQFLAYFLIK